jgi:hypothetical protein
MRSIEARYKEIAYDQPYLSSLMCLCGAVKGQDLSREAISRNLTKLVDKNDYLAKDRFKVISHLVALSKMSCGLPMEKQNGEKQGVKKLSVGDMYLDELLTPKTR